MVPTYIVIELGTALRAQRDSGLLACQSGACTLCRPGSVTRSGHHLHSKTRKVLGLCQVRGQHYLHSLHTSCYNSELAHRLTGSTARDACVTFTGASAPSAGSAGACSAAAGSIIAASTSAILSQCLLRASLRVFTLYLIACAVEA